MAAPELRLGVTIEEASSLFQVDGDLTRGSLPWPRMTSAQRNAITGTNGLTVFDTDLQALFIWQSGAWVQVTASVGVGTFVEVSLTGVGGNGFYLMKAQSADPAAPASAGMALFSNANSYLAWRVKNGSDTYTRQFIGVLTAARSYTLPDYDGTLATLAGLETLTNKTLTTPTIGDFTNAGHNHTNAANGGQLTDAALSAAVGLAKGGTGVDLSAAGGATYFLAQDASHAISARAIANADLGNLVSPPDIGTTTPAKGYFSDLREKIGGFYGIFSHANSADRTYTLPNLSGGVSVLTVTSVATAGGTTTTDNASAPEYVYTGTLNQTHLLPPANTIALGSIYLIRNHSTGVVTVKDAASGAVVTLAAGQEVSALVTNVGSSAGAWDVQSVTGTGSRVNATSPTIVTPTIAKLANLTSNGFVKVAGGDGTLGTYGGELFLSAAGGWQSLTNGCAPTAKWETATNKQDVWTLDFAHGVITYAQWGPVLMPASWDGGTITYAVEWIVASGTGDAVFTLEARAYADAQALDQAWGTGVDVTDTVTTAGDVDISATSSAVTAAGTPAGGNALMLRLSRKGTAAGDTLTTNARVLGVRIKFGVA